MTDENEDFDFLDNLDFELTSEDIKFILEDDYNMDDYNMDDYNMDDYNMDVYKDEDNKENQGTNI